MTGEVPAEAIASLADKIDSLSLTDEERVVLDAIFDRAADADEVEGFFLPDARPVRMLHDTAMAGEAGVRATPTRLNITRGLGLTAPPPIGK